MHSHFPANPSPRRGPRRGPRIARHGAAIPLSQLVCGALALFEGANLPPAERAALAAVGLHGGETLQVRQGGDSCIIQVGTTRLALSGPAARRILVRPLSPGDPM
ncbi:MAG: FeoA family protein [Planctomycetota bacterium]|jgi:Fe2+ transport system protein FeoA